ncbi:hypothetical protein B296_00054353 [Ensete ventricosum]|uniref:Rho-GAP domain-containing protein n=1 Tax=Ensete ventricosum TaxID=4639 RepID=A0A426Y493_ENSVE|nr:hypothetical protein B296_00054353 [Ensete ventricosum]
MQSEGIFRINAENSQEEYVRDQLNNGIVPEGIDVHCLAGLIKVYLQTFPLPALLNHCMVSLCCIHCIMADPLTALMYAVQVMNFLRMLILKTLKDREEPTLEDALVSNIDPSDDNGHDSPQIHLATGRDEATEQVYVNKKPVLDSLARIPEEKSAEDEAANSPQPSHDDTASRGAALHSTTENSAPSGGSSSRGQEFAANGHNSVHSNCRRKKTGRSNSQNHRKGRKAKAQTASRASLPAEKSKVERIVSRIDSKVERVEAWR